MTQTKITTPGITDTNITNAKLGTDISATKITADTLADARIPDLNASKITSGTLADARISASAVTQHVTATDLSGVNADITALALREATNESSAAFNLPNKFIETFTDDTNLGTQTTCDRVSGHMESSALADVSTTINNSNYTTYISSANVHHATNGGTFPLVTAGNYTAISNYATATNGSGTGVGTKGASLFGSNGDSDTSYWLINNGTATETANYYIVWIGLALAKPMALRDFSFKWRNGNTNFWNNEMYGYINASGGSAHNTDLVGGLNIGEAESITNGTTYTASTGWSGYSAAGWATQTTKVNYLWNKTFHYNGTQSFMFDELTITGLISLPVINATGTLIQSANTVGSAKTKVGGTMLYKDNAGTATIGTDLKIYFSCNNGGAWTEAASYNAITPVYSTGIKQVRLGETTCTSGTGVIYKAVWANQASGSKETQLHGIGINY
jgi:hypothetical protein